MGSKYGYFGNKISWHWNMWELQLRDSWCKTILQSFFSKIYLSEYQVLNYIHFLQHMM
jgi:hypothetical protein